jgi:heptosyltransferase-2
MGEAREKILVRGLNRLGDAVMSTPALQRLRAARPAAKITLLSPEKLGGLWQGQPFLDKVLTYAAEETTWNVGRRLRSEHFSEAVALPNSLRSALELWLARIPQRFGLRRPGRSLFLNHALPQRPGAVTMRKRSDGEIRRRLAQQMPPETWPPSAHQIHDYLYLTSALGASLESLPPRVFVEESTTAATLQRFRIQSDSGSKWFGLNPGAEYGPAKRWPAARFAAAAILLYKQTGCRWLIFGGREDVPLAEKIVDEIRFAKVPPETVLNLAGKTSLPELAAALKTCRLLLTNDTGPMHLAAAVGTPVVALFGSTSPELTGPGTTPTAKVVRMPPPCAPCFRRECPVDLRCFNDISIGQVAEAVREALERP